jgi:multidrug transporter EmrE-like cation transporter
MIILTVVQIPMRSSGLTLGTYGLYVLGVLGGTAWLLPLAIKNAPSFTGYWFVAIGTLSILGYLTGCFMFKESLSLASLVGIALILMGSYLLK